MTALEQLQALPIWQGTVRATPLGGGITNVNFVAEDDNKRVVVRVGDDIAVHQIMRFNELSASQAAHAAGVSPQVLYHAPGILVIDFIEGRSLTADDFQDMSLLGQAIDLVARAHREIPHHLRGPSLIFWVYHVIRDYAATLQTGGSRYQPLLADLLTDAARLEKAVGPIDLVFGHNDLLPANFMQAPDRLWLIDWDYAGFNTPLFDLGGLAANNGLGPAQERWMLERYFDHPADDALLSHYHAMKAAAALRETLWAMVSEQHSALDFDFAAYTQTNLASYRQALDHFLQS